MTPVQVEIYESRRHGRGIGVRSGYADKELVSVLPGALWDPDEKVWWMPRTFAACLQLRGQFGDRLVVGPELATWSVTERTTRVDPSHTLRSCVDRVVDGDFTWDDRLYDFQTAGVAFMDATDGAALLGDDMGLGKTAQVLALLRHLLGRLPTDEVLPALVICPNSVKTGWETQVELWKIPVTPYVVAGGAAERRRIIQAASQDPRALVIVNIEAVRLLSRLAPYGSVALARCRECDSRHGQERLTATRCEVHPKPLNTLDLRTVVLDEAHRTKDPRSKQTRACWAVGHGPTVRRRYALTGTPIADSIGDLWSVMHFIAPKEYPVKSKFVDLYGLQAWNAYGGLDIIGVNPQRRDEFFAVLDARFRRTPKALVLPQLPKVVRATRWASLSTKQSRAYREMEQASLTTIGDTPLMARNSLERNLRMLQLASAYGEVELNEAKATPDDRQCDCYYRDDNAERRHAEICPFRWKISLRATEPSPKLDVLDEIADELGTRQFVVAALSSQLIDLAARRFTQRGIPHGLITGAVGEFERRRVVQRLRSGDIRAVLMTIDAGGTGVDGLQVADTLVVLQRSWSMLANVQLEGRVDRIGSERHESITIIDVVAQGTLEETRLFPRLQQKWARLEEINRDRARLAAAGAPHHELFVLEQAEASVIHSDLGEP